MFFTRKPDKRTREAIDMFNRHEFRNALLKFEEPWKETYGQEERFLRALIQVSSAFHHFSENRLESAIMLYKSSIDLLSNYTPKCQKIDVESLISEIHTAFRELEKKGTQSAVKLDETLIPIIKLK